MQQQCCSGRSPFPTAPSSQPVPQAPQPGGLQPPPPGSGLGFVPDTCRKLFEALERETIPPPPLPPRPEIGHLITPFPTPTTSDSGQEVGVLPPRASSSPKALCTALTLSHCASSPGLTGHSQHRWQGGLSCPPLRSSLCWSLTARGLGPWVLPTPSTCTTSRAMCCLREKQGLIASWEILRVLLSRGTVQSGCLGMGHHGGSWGAAGA